jgi:OmpA-OmpF porin, OOP family
MKLPLWLPALLLLLWTGWSTHRYYCVKCGCCGAGSGTEMGSETSGEPLFKWNAEKPDADNQFKKFKAALLKKGGQGDTLTITGLYRAKETGGEKLGLARAAALKAMMMPELPESRIHLAAKQTTDALAEGGSAMASAAFGWSKMMLKMEESAIIESDNSTIILFPFNSTEKDKDAKVDAFLQSLCQKHKGDNKSISIVGHTDNVGEEKENEALGLGRAKSVARILSACGIAASRISTASKGETEPAADNSTDDGRHQNRRVVITVQ